MVLKYRNYIVEKSILLILGIALLLIKGYQPEMIIYPLIALAFSCLAYILRQHRALLLINLVIFLVICIFLPHVFPFLPFCFYDETILGNRKDLLPAGIVCCFVLLIDNQVTTQLKLLIIVLLILAYYLASKAKERKELADSLLKLTDESFEKQTSLKAKNTELLQHQDMLVGLEIAEERNRISRDIHDNVGHLLSSALLQLGAIQTVNQADNLKDPLEQLQNTISEGMTSIRESVHNLHAESISLQKGVENVLQGFTFCEVKLVGEFPDFLPVEYKLTIITVIKESLANVMKHSQAKCVTISFQNFPGFYQLMIADDGQLANDKTPIDVGIGLISLQERVSKLNGRLTYHKKETGFHLLIILPKEDRGAIHD